MRALKKIISVFLFITFLFLYSSCQRDKDKVIQQDSNDIITPLNFPKEYYEFVSVEILKKNTNKIPILMYHSIHGLERWIETDTFRSHLKLLYDAGFSTIKIDDYLKNNYSSVPDGRKPIIITFDDEWASQFYYTDGEGTKISPDCAVGIMEEFAKKNKAFGKNAVFYLFFHRLPFIGYDRTEFWKKKLLYLINSGFDLGSHTYDHSIMTKMSPERIKLELDRFYQILDPIISKNIAKTMTIAYPGGNIPNHFDTIKHYQYHGLPLKAALIAGGGLANVPVSDNKDIFMLPRIEASTSNILWLTRQKTFMVERVIIKVPKLFTTTKNSLFLWLQSNINQNKYYFFQELN